ncbi:MAG TPA: thioredoxin [Bacilli bacterium]
MISLPKIFSEHEKVLIDFYADWCGPCKMLAPIIEEIKNEMQGFLEVIKINVDEYPEIAEQYGVRSIPTLVYVKNGKVENVLVGFRPKKDILNAIK